MANILAHVSFGIISFLLGSYVTFRLNNYSQIKNTKIKKLDEAFKLTDEISNIIENLIRLEINVNEKEKNINQTLSLDIDNKKIALDKLKKETEETHYDLYNNLQGKLKYVEFIFNAYLGQSKNFTAAFKTITVYSAKRIALGKLYLNGDPDYFKKYQTSHKEFKELIEKFRNLLVETQLELRQLGKTLAADPWEFKMLNKTNNWLKKYINCS